MKRSSNNYEINTESCINNYILVCNPPKGIKNIKNCRVWSPLIGNVSNFMRFPLSYIKGYSLFTESLTLLS